MKRYLLLLILFVAFHFALSQGKMVFGSSPITTADENEISMKKLLKKSCHLPFYAGDTVADTVLLKMITADKSGCGHYCVRFKDDSTRIAIAVEKFGEDKYGITTYWKNRQKKRITNYNDNFNMSRKYAEYYENGWAKITGQYEDGHKDGAWVYYDKKGNKFRKEKYEGGLPIPPSH
jgi:hypothetical protein